MLQIPITIQLKETLFV